MAAWLFSGAASSQASDASATPVNASTSQSGSVLSFDELLNAATSELLPTPNVSKEDSILDAELLDKGLSLSDLVRSGSFKAPDAVKQFRKRLGHKNPNVVLRTLLVLDLAIKNSGDAFLKEVAGLNSSASASGSQTLVSDLADLIRTSTNHDVKSTTLRLFQNWATAFQSKPPLSISELVLTYTRLRSEERQPFPPVSSSATAAMIDSMSAPTWIDNSESALCSRCRDAFGVLNRRHHCRNCGQLFDQKCSSKSVDLPHFGIHVPVRVCDGCYKKVADRGNPISQTKRRASFESSSSYTSSQIPKRMSSAHYSRYSATNKESEDLQLALRLSLSESGQSQSYSAPSSDFSHGPLRNDGYRPAYPDTKKPSTDEEQDPDLAAAIAASLRDLENAPSAPPPDLSSQDTVDVPAVHSNFRLPPTVELAPYDYDSILGFVQGVEGHVDQRQLADLYRSSEACRGKLVKGVGDAGGREQVLVEMRDKLRDAMRLYEAMLDRAAEKHQARSSIYQGHMLPQHVAPLPMLNPYEGNRYTPAPRADQLSAAPPQQVYPSAYPSLPTDGNAPALKSQADPDPRDWQQHQVSDWQYQPAQNYSVSSYQQPSSAATSVNVPEQYQDYRPLSSAQHQTHSHQPYPSSVTAQPQTEATINQFAPVTATYAAHAEQSHSSTQAELNPHAQAYQPQQVKAHPQQADSPLRIVSQSGIAQQLANLPHAPQNAPQQQQQFPNVPHHDTYEQPQREADGMLIEL